MTGVFRAILCERLGPPENLILADLPRRPLQPHEVRVVVRAAGVNFPDLLKVAGEYQHKSPLPFVPGFEAAGEIIETGRDVTAWRHGGAVIVRARGGGYADEIVATEDTLLPKPAGWSWAEAAAFPVAAATAWAALVHRGRLKQDETLLVLGAGGGTGLAAVALGRQLGAEVVAVASTAEKRAAAIAAGAGRAIDPSESGWERTVQADAVFDPVGGKLFESAWRALSPGGRWLVVGFAGGEMPKLPANRLLLREAELSGVRAGELGRREPAVGRHQQAALTEWLVSGEGRPYIGGRYRLEDAAVALRALADRLAIGKLVLLTG